ncbi:glycerol-3-phosphate cytidylyltransferase [Virgibacillus oceani]|uniref:Glycerol-3-phosphate cytidylyltransferase n=1 Tax=Virgibacillus oceani TaxID=1479511 RepID=A0A917M2Q3_9BACI|nr:glycerol-3-phosphate cytidylyltransferase [Virgibacillus oceani]GGG73460.1 glycerol-3-phosphate cytidylyltransferase [Virgibacillus oceani]
MKKVITYGTFDLLHTGHINILRRAKELGDYLIVAISADEFNALKGKEAYYSFEQRKAILEAIRYVDEVIPEKNWEQKVTDVQKHDVDVFVMGDDWEGKFDFLKNYCQVVYLPRTVGISTTKIKNDLQLSNNG